MFSAQPVIEIRVSPTWCPRRNSHNYKAIAKYPNYPWRRLFAKFHECEDPHFVGPDIAGNEPGLLGGSAWLRTPGPDSNTLCDWTREVG